MKGRLFLNVVVGKGATVFELLSSENETLLVWWDTLLILKIKALEKVRNLEALDFRKVISPEFLP